MKNEIVTFLKNQHPIYDDNFKRNNIKIGKAYKCVDELVLTTETYYKPEFATLKGITIKSHVDKWGWSKPCLPKECFRLATIAEIKRYQMLIKINAPFRFIKIWFFKLVRKIDRVVRWKYYQRMNKFYEDYY